MKIVGKRSTKIWYIQSTLILSLLAVLGTGNIAHADSKSLATVNNHKITAQDVENEMGIVPEKLIAGRQHEIQKAIVERLIQKRLVMDEAEKLGITKDETYQSQLATLKENLIFNFVLSRKIEEKVTDESLQAFYQKNKENFTQRAIKVKHILLPTKEEAEQILEKLNNKAEFTILAQKFSTGPSAANGGDLGWVYPGEMVPVFEDAAFILKEGEHSKEPLKTQFGWHVIFVEEKNPARTKPFKDVEDELLKELNEKVVQDYLDALKKKAEIVYEAN